MKKLFSIFLSMVLITGCSTTSTPKKEVSNNTKSQVTYINVGQGDSTLIQNYAKSSPKDETLLGTVDAFTLHLADIDGTGVINTADSTIIRNMSSGRIIPTN